MRNKLIMCNFAALLAVAKGACIFLIGCNTVDWEGVVGCKEVRSGISPALQKTKKKKQKISKKQDKLRCQQFSN